MAFDLAFDAIPCRGAPGRIRGKIQRLDTPRLAPHVSQRSKAAAPRPPKEAGHPIFGGFSW